MAKKNDIMSINLNRYSGRTDNNVHDKNTKSTHNTHAKMAQYVAVEEEEKKKETELDRISLESRKNEKSVEKAKRINMRFGDEVYNHIIKESERLCVNTSAYVNEMICRADPEKIDEYYNGLLVKPSRNFVARKRKEKSHQINITIRPDVREKLLDKSEKYNQTMTQYVNMIISADIC